MNSIKDAKRVVVKVGTSTLAYPNGKLNIRRIEDLVKVLSDLKNQGREVVLVSSGAIGAGVGTLNLPSRPSEVRMKQAVAAIGQIELMNVYRKFFADYGHHVAQVLLTKDVVDDDHRKENAIETFKALLSLGVVPIVNENDVISYEEIEFGDNDTLSAVVASLIDAELLILLSDIDGLYDSDPHKNENAKLIQVVEEITDEIKHMATGSSTKQGTGGMTTKLKAAEIATSRGINMIIANGNNPSKTLYTIFDEEPCGTLFLGKEKLKRM